MVASTNSKSDNGNLECSNVVATSKHKTTLGNLPFPLRILSESDNRVESLVDCARNEIACMERELEENAADYEILEDCLDDGFVLCDVNVIQTKIQRWYDLFPRIHPFYALKCNPDPMVAHWMSNCSQMPVGYDCASLQELKMALQARSTSSCDASERISNSILYAHPQRAERELEAAIEMGIEFYTFDGPEELYKIHRARQKLVAKSACDTQIQMILRILVPDSESTVPLGEKFGATPQSIKQLCELARKLQLAIVGVSFHCGSGCHNPESYSTAIRLAYDAMQTVEDVFHGYDENYSCWLLDIGGGFPGQDGMVHRERFSWKEKHAGQDPHQDQVDDTAPRIAEAINPLLDELFPLRSANPVKIVSEPGRYFVEEAFCLCSRIYKVESTTSEDDKKTHFHYTIAQGVQGVFKDVVLCQEEFVPIPLTMATSDDDSDPSTLYASTIHGPSDHPYDVVCANHALPRLQVGDWLLFDRMGAYTLSISARNGKPPIRYVLGGQTA